MTRLCLGRFHGGSSATRGGTHTRLTGARRARHRLVGTLAIAAVTALLTACSGASHPATPASTTSGTPTPSSTPTATRTGPVPPTPLGYAPADPDRIGAWLVIQPFASLTPEQKVVAQRLMTYRQAMTQAINQRTIDFKVLDGLATGNSRRDSLQVIGERIKRGQFTVGQTTIQVRSVQVDKTTATVEICQDDHSYEVDLHGKVAVPAPGVALSRYKMLLVNGKWLVTQQPDYVLNGCSIQATS
jgi:hypothetical protein